MTRKPTRADAVRAVVAAHPELRRKPARVAVLASRDGCTVSRQAAADAMRRSATQGRPRRDVATVRAQIERAAIDADANSRRLTGYALRWEYSDEGALLDRWCATIASGRVTFTHGGACCGYMLGTVEQCARHLVALGFSPTKGGE